MSGRPLLLDLGRPLTEGPGLEERYVGLYPDAEASLTEWLAALPGESTPRRATVFGQLGIGKTTLIRRCMAHAGPDCDVSFNLASGPWSPLPGIVCLDVVTAIARRLGGELPAAAEACLCGPGGLWEGLPAERTAVRLEDLFRPERLTPAVEEDRRQVDDWVQRYPDAVADATKSAVQGLGTHLGRIPLLVIEGLDVLGRRSAWYLGVRMVLTAATGWEAHLLMETGWGLGSDVGQPWQREVDERVLLVVAPDHGPIWRGREDVERIIGDYGRWADGSAGNKAVVVYDTMWHSTARMARAVGEGLAAGGAKAKLMSMSACHRSDVVAELLDAGALIVGSPTMNNNILPSIADVLTYIKGLKPRNLVAAAFGSYGWSGEAPKCLHAMLAEIGLSMVAEPLRVNYVPDEAALSQCRQLGETVAKQLLGVCTG